jgi:hypothetical protein
MKQQRMKRMVRPAVLIALAVLGTPAVAAATWNEIPGQTVTQAEAPVDIQQFWAYVTDDKRQLLACIGFVNHGPAAATAIKFRVFQSDSFGEVQSSGDKEIDGQFAPDIPILIKRGVLGLPNDGENRCFTSVSRVEETRTAVARIEKVLFSDGSVWTSPLYGLRTPLKKNP